MTNTTKDGRQREWVFPEESDSSPLPDIAPLKPTPVFDTYWRFAAERQQVFFKRHGGDSAPWTLDPVLQTYKFTNAYRASDRVSQYLIRRVIYRDDLPNSMEEVFFRTLLFKVFNRIDTWELLESSLGGISYETYNFKRYDSVLSTAMDEGQRIYSAAYIMPSARPFGHKRKHQNHLELIDRMLADELPEQLANAGSMQRAFDLLLAYPTIGNFLAYQYITDLNYSELTNFTEMEFVVAGPGAVNGIRKCFEDRAGLNDAEIIRFMTDRQELEFTRLGLEFRKIGDRRLQLIDCQNLFCEVDKYSRIRHPEYNAESGRSRIKQRFRPNFGPIEYWYPPKWKLSNIGFNGRSNKVLETGRENGKVRSGMHLNSFQEIARETDKNPTTDQKGMIIPLLGLAGEAGELLSEYKKCLRDGESLDLFRDRFAEELGDLLWYVSNVADKFGLTLQEIADFNIEKNQSRWGEQESKPPFDAAFPEGEQLPRQFQIDFNTVHDENGKPWMKAYFKGKKFGDDLTDNAHDRDDYRFHDIFHLAFAAVLGWSPVTRKLMERKRRSSDQFDEVEDGGRARVIEEGVSALIFAYAKDYNWLEGTASVSSELLRAIKNMTFHLEVSRCTTGEWENAIIQGFAMWRKIRKRGGGTLEVDLDKQILSIKEL